MTTFWDAAQELQKSGTSFSVVTFVSGRGHTPQDPGAKAIITSMGLTWGTVGGGKVEARAITFAQTLLKDERPVPTVVTWNLQKDIGMTCGGEVTFLFEVHKHVTWNIALFGAGHVSQALVRTLANLDCHVTCIDPRAEWIERMPASSKKFNKFCEADPSSRVSAFSENTYFVVMTQGHATDVPILKTIFHSFPNAPFFGGIGSDVKGLKIREELKAFGISGRDVLKFRCPIGLPIGTNDPYEIAISITAQLLQVRDQLRERSNDPEAKPANGQDSQSIDYDMN